MEETYRIVFSGELLAGVERAEVIGNLSSITKMAEEKAEKLLHITRPTVLKKGLTRKQAKQLADVLTKAGLQVSVKSDTPPGETRKAEFKHKESVSPEPPPQKPEVNDNPYATPAAELNERKTEIGGWLSNPRKVAAMRGWSWIGGAAKLFFKEPVKWLVMGFIAIVVSSLVSLIPFIGSLIYYIPAMVLAGGFMIAAQQQMQGNSLEIRYIFDGFSHQRNQLLLVGGIYCAGLLVIGLIAAVLIFVMLGASFLPLLLGDTSSPEMFAGSPASAMMILVVVLVALGLSVPLIMAVWFAAPLVSLTEQNAVSALKLSFRACLKNIIPFLVYGLAFLVIGGLFLAAVAALTGVLSFLVGDGGSLLFVIVPFAIMLLLGLPLIVISGLTVYTGFVDIFSTSTE